MNSGSFWKADWFIGVLVTLLFMGAFFVGFGPLHSLEKATYDFGVSFNAKPASDQIVIVGIDNDSIDRLGRWPWDRSVIANMINKLSNAGARLIGIDIFFSEEQKKGQNYYTGMRLAELYKQQGKQEEAERVLEEIKAQDMDGQLVEATQKAGNVVMPMFFDLGKPIGNPDTPLPPYVTRMNITNIGQTADADPLHIVKLRYPFPDLAKAAASLGHLVTVVDSDGAVRTEPLVVEYFGDFYPSMSLAIAAKHLNLTMSDIRLNLGEGIELGALDIGTDQSMRLYPAFYTGENPKKAFVEYSFSDVASDRIPDRLFKDKIVLIGITADGVSGAPFYVTPVNNKMPGVQFNAHVVQSILNADFFTVPAWGAMLELLLLLLVGVYLSFVLPRLKVILGVIASGTLLIILLLTSFIMLTGSAIWIQTMSSAALLVFGHLLLTTKRHFATEEERVKITADSAETNKMLGLSFQSQGMLDMAFDKFRKCPLNDDMLATLYNLALDFERKRQFNKALSVYEHMSEANPNFKDISARIERVKTAGETMIFGSSSTGGGMSTLLITGGAKPTLGRYEIVKELGKGAMGTVYLGRDPKINREVAIKTMALSQEFEEDELKEVKERFFREAETAGRLNHPNIVTIFDAGEEHDLAYIAMEYLNGSDLAPYTKVEKLLPAAAVLKVCGKVAEALHYAHSQNVVHRDIKPANIMLLKDKTIKVTDFGIARITASSKTKTGVVLGTPSYMSPEQLSGKHVDGRSDLFSLGVMMYELLCGTRPFRGDSMATLMFQIANEPHPDIRELRPELPASFASMFDKILAKDAETRVKSGSEVVRLIIQCLKDVPAGGGK